MLTSHRLGRLIDIAHWLPGYLRDLPGRRRRRMHLQAIILCFVDHFEPLWNNPSTEVADRRMAEWSTQYPQIAAQIRDCTGRPLPHGWFYPYEEARLDDLEHLAELVFAGFGEIDLHLHHFRDTPEGLREKLAGALAMYARYGALRDIQNRPSFGFIHGNWALGNTRPEFCGVQGELEILREFGCYGDFTFPAPNRCQPRTTNRVYCAREGNARPIEFGAPLAAFPARTLPIVQGPVALARIAGQLHLEDGEVDAHKRYTPERLRVWVRSAVTVSSRTEWGFVKIFTHGAPENSARAVLTEFLPLLGEGLNALPVPVVFATAREMLNIAYAAAAGETGEPADYRDSYMAPPLGSRVWSEGGADIRVEADGSLQLQREGKGKVLLKSPQSDTFELAGAISAVTAAANVLKVCSAGPVRISASQPLRAPIRGTQEDASYRPDSEGNLWLPW